MQALVSAKSASMCLLRMLALPVQPLRQEVCGTPDTYSAPISDTRPRQYGRVEPLLVYWWCKILILQVSTVLSLYPCY